MTIRLATPQDFVDLARVFSESFTVAEPEKPWPPERAQALVEHFYRHQPDLFFVAVAGDTVVGGVAVLIKPWRDGNRCTEGVLFVAPGSQRSGVGKALLVREIEEALAKYAAQTFESITFAAKQFPLTWYEKIGFKPDENAVFIKGSTQEMLEKLRGNV